MSPPPAAAPERPGRDALAEALRPRWRGLAVLLSFALCAPLPLLSPSPFGDLSWHFTDHLRQAHLSWLSLHVGLDVYREAFVVAAAQVPYRHPLLVWPWVPYAYPPLVLVLFAPYALAMQYLPLSAEALARLGILYTLGLAHLALWAVLRALGRLDLVKGALALVAWAMLMRAGLQGFYDPLWLACGALMVRRLAQRRPGAALAWFTVAALLSYRAVVLGPLALAALSLGVRRRPVRAWPWASAGLALGASLVCLTLFSFTLPFAWGFREGPSLLERGGVPLAAVLVAGLGAALVTARGADPVVAATVVAATALGLVDTPQWWHALILLPAPLAVGAWRRARWPRLSLLALVCWTFVLHKQAWGSAPSRLLKDVLQLAQNAPRRNELWRPGNWYSRSAWRWVPPGLHAPPRWDVATAWLWASPTLPSPLLSGAPAVLRPPGPAGSPWVAPERTALARRALPPPRAGSPH